LARRNGVEYASKVEIDCAKARGDLISYKMESQKSFNKYTQTINDLNQTILEMKNKLSEHQETISIMSQQKEAQIKLYKTREDKELDKDIALENKVKVSDNIVYKTDQSVQMINMLNNKCRMSFAKPEFLKKAQRANPRLYDIGCYNDNLASMLAPESDEVIRLENESRSRLSDLIRPFDYDKLNNLYDLFVPQHSLRSQLETQKIQFLNEIDRLSKEYYYADHMNSILGVYTELDEDLKAQLQDKGIVIRVISTTSVSRPQLKSNPMEDRVLLKNSRGKKQEVEDQRRNVKLSKNKMFVTACNDNLNDKKLNVNFVCATCGKCLLNDKHDMCVLNSVAKPLRKIVASESNQKPRNSTRKLYECIRAVTIKMVYYVEGLNHNLFSVCQFCDADLEVAFRKSTCYIRDLKGNDL
nr:integrase, catalytic region, zinc finger, CCHC-type, peptidase aspartic, catalytic [Tanacetum cinerariifolium]